MKLDEVIDQVEKDLGKTRDKLKQNMLLHHHQALKMCIPIRVKTKVEADNMLDVFRASPVSFPYPFGSLLSWIEIPLDQNQYITYIVMPPDEKWPHWQVYLNPNPPNADARFMWSADGRIGPYKDKPGGQPVGPTVWVYQDPSHCHNCRYFEIGKDESDLVCLMEEVETADPTMIPFTRGLACEFTLVPDSDRCPKSPDFWNAALLPISIIMYIALAPTKELDVSWQPKRTLGKGKNEREKRGYYLITPIKKVYIKRRLEHFITSERRQIEVTYFVRGHNRREHMRRKPKGEGLCHVRGSWVKAHWRGPEQEDLPPHYSLAWGPDERIESAKRLRSENSV
jgi:hypothetical protein